MNVIDQSVKDIFQRAGIKLANYYECERVLFDFNIESDLVVVHKRRHDGRWGQFTSYSLKEIEHIANEPDVMAAAWINPDVFQIDEQYLVSVTADGELFDGTNIYHVMGTQDHAKFTELRNELEQQGYISTWRTVWNGDRVLKPFTLNDFKFNKGDQFPCGVALGNRLKVKRKLRVNQW